MSRYDAVIVGGGAAGLSAALVLARARRRVAVVDAGQPRNAPAHVHGFLGSDGLPPATLLAGRREVAGYFGDLFDDRVTDIRPVAADGAHEVTKRPADAAHGLRGRAYVRVRRIDPPDPEGCARARPRCPVPAGTRTQVSSWTVADSSW